ncbi:unnamed protein product [Chrysoparadoxa australica]
MSAPPMSAPPVFEPDFSGGDDLSSPKGRGELTDADEATLAQIRRDINMGGIRGALVGVGLASFMFAVTKRGTPSQRLGAALGSCSLASFFGAAQAARNRVATQPDTAAALKKMSDAREARMNKASGVAGKGMLTSADRRQVENESYKRRAKAMQDFKEASSGLNQ